VPAGSTNGSNEERRWLEKIQRWAAGKEDCLWLDRVEVFRSCRVAGVVQRLRIDPEARAIEATITDAATQLRARWRIRTPAPQLRAAPGSGLILEGIARVDPRGGLVMVEPSYEIVPGPERD
jgi:hypothetical protein